mmetsp:Transcript_3067/g.7123  ORF Transcript_3067/g.7123 Transcript_3067/m.7123 type:complete len:238 (+) Transcript_3067:366-1079(+)
MDPSSALKCTRIFPLSTPPTSPTNTSSGCAAGAVLRTSTVQPIASAAEAGVVARVGLGLVGAGAGAGAGAAAGAAAEAAAVAATAAAVTEAAATSAAVGAGGDIELIVFASKGKFSKSSSAKVPSSAANSTFTVPSAGYTPLTCPTNTSPFSASGSVLCTSTAQPTASARQAGLLNLAGLCFGVSCLTSVVTAFSGDGFCEIAAPASVFASAPLERTGRAVQCSRVEIHGRVAMMRG